VDEAWIASFFAFLESEIPRCDVLRFGPLDPQSPFAVEFIRIFGREC